MRKLGIIISCALLFSCNGTDQGGVVNDGTEDSSRLNTETVRPNDPATDSTRSEDRVDTWKRDSTRKDSL